MKHALLRISGTFGSGKTTAARDFLKYPHTELYTQSSKKVQGYHIEVPGLAVPVFLLGSYKNVCGGCDGIPTQDEIAERALRAHPYGHVLMEGALLSGAGVNGAVTRAVHSTGCDVYTFLDTPLEECITRVKIRRATAGNEKPFDPKNLVHKFESVVSTYKALRAAGGYDARLVDHTNIHPQLLAILAEYENA
ncbi:MAG: hypothetical protein ACR2IJ_02170 [Fluviibacter sp.]